MLNSPPSQRISPHISLGIDCIRGLACLGVIWGHSIYGFKYPLELNGAFWVWVFFPISGYLVGKGFINKNYQFNTQGVFNFLFNRGLRILPLAYLALSFGILIFAISKVDYPPLLIKQFLFISPLNNMKLSGPLWSVAVEVQFYFIAVLFVPLLLYIDKTLSLCLIFLVFLASLWLSYFCLSTLGDSSAQPRTLICNLPFFIFGFFLAALKPLRIRYAGIIQTIILIGFTSLAWYLNNYKAEYFWSWGAPTLPFGGGAAIAILLVGTVVLLDEKRLSNPGINFLQPIRWCGLYCYGIYVWHSILATMNNNLFKIGPGIELLAFLSASVLIAPLSYQIIEKPFLRFKKTKN